jgi:predicted anti-sigma-YlaC factor YlaD
MSDSTQYRHPSAEEIVALRDVSSVIPDRVSLEEHVATCLPCLGIYRAVGRLESDLHGVFIEQTSRVDCPEEWEIAALIREEASFETQGRVRAHLPGCTHCLDIAAGFQRGLTEISVPASAPDAWREKAVTLLSREMSKAVAPTFAESVASRDREESVPARFRAFIQGVIAPLMPLPGFGGYAAAAALVVALVAWTVLTPGRSPKISIVPGTERIVRGPSGASGAIGFMDQPDESNAVSAMKVSIRGEQVVFSWAPVEGNRDYSFRLVEHASERTVVPLAKTDHSEAVVSVSALQVGSRYDYAVGFHGRAGSRGELAGTIELSK